MKTSRVLLAIATASVLAVGALAPAASADDLPQPLVLTGPTNGSKLDTPYPTFTWQAPAGEQIAEIRVSRSDATSGGELPIRGKNYVTVDDAVAGSGSYTDGRYAYSPDTYYWQVTSTDAEGVEYRSAVQKFVVPVIFEISKVKVKASRAAYNGARVVQANAVMKCNFSENQYYTQFRMEVYKGKKRVSSGGVGAGDCVGMFAKKQTAIYEVPAGTKKGTKFTVKVFGESTHDSTKRWGGADIKKATGPVTSVKFTWK